MKWKCLIIVVSATACSPIPATDAETPDGDDAPPTACAMPAPGEITYHAASGFTQTRPATRDRFVCAMDNVSLGCGDNANGGSSGFGMLWTRQRRPVSGDVLRIGADLTVHSATVCGTVCGQWSSSDGVLRDGTLTVTIAGDDAGLTATVNGCATSGGTFVTFNNVRVSVP